MTYNHIVSPYFSDDVLIYDSRTICNALIDVDAALVTHFTDI